MCKSTYLESNKIKFAILWILYDLLWFCEDSDETIKKNKDKSVFKTAHNHIRDIICMIFEKLSMYFVRFKRLEVKNRLSCILWRCSTDFHSGQISEPSSARAQISCGPKLTIEPHQTLNQSIYISNFPKSNGLPSHLSKSPTHVSRRRRGHRRGRPVSRARAGCAAWPRRRPAWPFPADAGPHPAFPPAPRGYATGHWTVTRCRRPASQSHHRLAAAVEQRREAGKRSSIFVLSLLTP